MGKVKYKDKIAAMFALASCRKAGERGCPNRKEKRIYKYKGSYYLTSHEDKFANKETL